MTQELIFSPKQMFDRLRLSAQTPALVQKIITSEIIRIASDKANLNVEPEELQQAVDNWRLVNKLDSIEATQSWLVEHHLSLEELGELISENILTSKLAQFLFGNKVEPYFTDYQLDYMQVCMYEIILDDEDMAMELSYAMDEGEITFFQAAYQYIPDPELSRRGGYKGTVYRKDLKPEISAAVFAAEPPQILRPITTSNGVHLIRVEAIAKPTLDEAMRQKITKELFDSWLMQQRRQFNLKIVTANRQHVLSNTSRQMASV